MDLPKTEKPINSVRAMFGVEIHCMCCGAKLTGWAYLIDTCQECGREKQERRRQLACLRKAREIGQRLAEERDRKIYEAMFGEQIDG